MRILDTEPPPALGVVQHPTNFPHIMVLQVEGKSHLQWANMVIDYEGKEANLEKIYNMSVQELADYFNEGADAKSEPGDEECDDEELDQMEEDAKVVKAEYRELLKAKKKAAKAPKKKPVKRAASDSDEDEDEDETELEKPPKKKPGRKSHGMDVWDKFLFAARTSMSAPQYGNYAETKNWDLKKPVMFKTKNGWAFKKLDWGQSEPRKYFWKKFDDNHPEEGEYY